MNKLQQLREVIIKTQPEIMELKFGCHLLFGDVRTCFLSLENDGHQDFYYIFPRVNGVDSVYPNQVVILGRPIRLVDIVLAISEIESGMSAKRFDEVCMRIIQFYNLLDDDLNHQSEAFINFLHGLLYENS